MIYLDNAATTKPDPLVVAEMLPWLSERYGNPGALYPFGQDAKQAVEAARCKLSWFLSCKSENIVFTSGGSEGNNLVIKGLVPHMKKIGKSKILYSAIEHDSLVRAVGAVCAQHGFVAEEIPVTSDGVIDMDVFESMLTDDVGLVSVMFVNNELGVQVWPENFGKFCRDRGVLLHSDCVQAAYDYALNTDGKNAPDFLTISSHKLHGPKGVGAIYVRDPETLSPLVSGGHEQEHDLRGGTENVAGIVGFAKACDLIYRDEMGSLVFDPSELLGAFVEELNEAVGFDNLHYNGNKESRKTISVTIPGVDAQSLVLMAGANDLCISAGSACRSLESSPSRTLKAIGLSDEDARSTIRVSFSRMNNVYEARDAARIIAGCVEALKGVKT